MTAYIARRFLLMVPTLLGITVVCFLLIQFIPGGPVEQLISKIHASSSIRGMHGNPMSTQEIENIKAYFGFDKPAYVRYFTWLGNLVRGDLGTSYVYQQPVLKVIADKFPISLFFGLVSFFLAYAISIPLGVRKALTNGSWSDTASSVLVFAGYIIPEYALGILLIIFFAGGTFLDWFPLGGIVSENFEHLAPLDQGLDFLHHMVLPLICYMVGEFAFLTLLMKNSILEELNKDYVRTAMAKGMSFRATVWKQVFRNALIPIATGIGSLFTVLFTSALLIERVFDIDGMGLLFYNSMLGRDYNVVLGIIVLSSVCIMLGRLFSDLIYVAVDPRIRFD
jgi:microcin C transport system permease protein